MHHALAASATRCQHTCMLAYIDLLISVSKDKFIVHGQNLIKELDGY